MTTWSAWCSTQSPKESLEEGPARGPPGACSGARCWVAVGGAPPVLLRLVRAKRGYGFRAARATGCGCSVVPDRSLGPCGCRPLALWGSRTDAALLRLQQRCSPMRLGTLEDRAGTLRLRA